MNNKLFDKIKKLLALADSENQHEAQSASSKAQKLLIKHNLDMQTIKDYSAEYNDITLGVDKKRRATEDKFVTDILRKYFSVEILTTRNPENKDKIGYRFFGEPHNIEIATYMFGFLSDAMKKSFLKHKRNSITKTCRSSFYYGFWKGLCEQMEETKREVEQESGLVVTRDPGIQRYMNFKVGKVRYSRSFVSSKSASDVSQGYKSGKSLKLRRGVSSQKSNEIKYLGRG